MDNFPTSQRTGSVHRYIFPSENPKNFGEKNDHTGPAFLFSGQKWGGREYLTREMVEKLLLNGALAAYWGLFGINCGLLDQHFEKNASMMGSRCQRRRGPSPSFH